MLQLVSLYNLNDHLSVFNFNMNVQMSVQLCSYSRLVFNSNMNSRLSIKIEWLARLGWSSEPCFDLNG
jgi:hypothetical protein